MMVSWLVNARVPIVYVGNRNGLSRYKISLIMVSFSRLVTGRLVLCRSSRRCVARHQMLFEQVVAKVLSTEFR
jgi:hypothetical protein